jgi:hypothetical protein
MGVGASHVGTGIASENVVVENLVAGLGSWVTG